MDGKPKEKTQKSYEKISVQADNQIRCVSDLRARTLSLRNELTNLQGNILHHQDYQKMLEGDIGVMNIRNELLENDVAELFMNGENLVASTKSFNESLETIRSEDKEKRDTYEQKVKELLNESRSAPVNYDVSKLKSRIDEIKLEYEEIQHDLESVQSELSLLKEKYKPDENFSNLNLDNAQDLLKTIVAENKKDIADNEGKMQQPVKSLNDLMKKSNQLEAEIAEKEREIKNISMTNSIDANQ